MDPGGRKRGSTTSKYYGVRLKNEIGTKRTWEVRIYIGKKPDGTQDMINVGLFDTEQEAAKAYDIALARAVQSGRIAADLVGSEKKFEYNLGEPTAAEIAAGYKRRTAEDTYASQLHGVGEDKANDSLSIHYVRPPNSAHPTGEHVNITKVGKASSAADKRRAYKFYDCAIADDPFMMPKRYNFGEPSEDERKEFRKWLLERSKQSKVRQATDFPRGIRPFCTKAGVLSWHVNLRDTFRGRFDNLSEALALRDAILRKEFNEEPNDGGITIDSAMAAARKKFKLDELTSSSSSSAAAAAASIDNEVDFKVEPLIFDLEDPKVDLNVDADMLAAYFDPEHRSGSASASHDKDGAKKPRKE